MPARSEGVINTAQRIDKSALKTAYATPETKQEHIVTDAGDIFFRVNSDAINWSVPLNKDMKNKTAVNALMAHIMQGWNIDDIEVVGCIWLVVNLTISHNLNLIQLGCKCLRMTLHIIHSNQISINTGLSILKTFCSHQYPV